MDFYLRFTVSVEDDMKYKQSIWMEYEYDNPNNPPKESSEGVKPFWSPEWDCWCYPHKGLSGHYLEAETLEEAIEEVMQGSWFGNPEMESWAIFEGEEASSLYGVSTPEGDDFTPIRVVYTHK